MKSNKGLKSGIVILVLLLAIGFAAVTTQLYINGTIRIGTNATDFETNVVFDGATATGSAEQGVTGDANASALISNDGKSITFTTQILDHIDETSSVEFSVKNASSYAAQLGTMKCSFGSTYDESTANTTISNTYITVVSDDALNGVTLQPNQSTNVSATGITVISPAKTGTITVTQNRSYAGETNPTTYSITCRMTATAAQPSGN